ncbi:MAG: NAD(P)-dependent oxidoreductase [Peptostreptococcaceae bacterium]|nr:NAD(P)-dependent oxidoreductase [Peptostreptococcaceae bacterium]
MRYYPAMLNLEKKKVLLIGLGAVGLRKLTALFDTGAEIFVIAGKRGRSEEQIIKALCRKYPGRSEKELDVFLQALRISREDFSFERHENLLKQAQMILLCTNDGPLQLAVRRYARQRGIWTLRCDLGEDSDFISPAVVEDGPLQIAVSSSGSNPSFSKEVRAKIEDFMQGLEPPPPRSMKSEKTQEKEPLRQKSPLRQDRGCQ